MGAGGGASGAITMTDLSTINGGSGTITLTADENISLAGLTTTSALPIAVTLTTAAGGIIDNDSADVYIGVRSNQQYYFNGTIDDVRIYNKALSDEEIQQLYLAGL